MRHEELYRVILSDNNDPFSPFVGQIFIPRLWWLEGGERRGRGGGSTSVPFGPLGWDEHNLPQWLGAAYLPM